MIEKIRRNFAEWKKKRSSTNEYEKPNPRKVYKDNIKRAVSEIKNLQVKKETLIGHLINTQSTGFHGARCLVILSEGIQTKIGDKTIISMPGPWQHLIGGEQIELNENGIKSYKAAARKYEEAYPKKKSKN